MTKAEKAALYVVNIFAAEEDYIEKASNANLDSKTANAGNKNYTKYGRDVDAIANFYNGKKQGYEWCDVSHDWCHIQAWGAELAKKVLYQPDASCGAGCNWSASYYRQHNAFFKVPKIGDQIFFGPAGHETHTGMVRDVDNKYVYTIEGNSSNAVRLKKYLLTDASIAGYGRPNYELVADHFDEKPKLDNIPAAWAETSVRWCVENGLMAGDENGNLMLHSGVTREQLACILDRFAQSINK